MLAFAFHKSLVVREVGVVGFLGVHVGKVEWVLA
jgi:hypothetical protein